MPDQNQTPDQQNAGEEQQGNQPSNLEDRLKKVQDELAVAREEQSKAEKEAKLAQREAKTHQRRADRLANAVSKQKPQSPASQTRAGRVQPNAEAPSAQEQLEALGEYANEQAKEAALLREVIDRGLTLEDVDGLEFESQTELDMQLNIIQQNKEIASLRQQIADRPQEGGAAETGETASTVVIDTGGVQSGNVGDAQFQQAEEYRKKARELKSQGKYKEASWLALRAAHIDPNKASLVRKEE